MESEGNMDCGEHRRFHFREGSGQTKSEIGISPNATFRVIAFACLLFLAACVSPHSQNLQRYEFERPQMGVPFRIVLYAASESHATNAAHAAFSRVSHLNNLMSDYEYESELSRLGRTSGTGQKIKVSEELWTVLSTAEKFSRASDGAFDATIGPVVQLWRRARRERQLPSPETLEKARARVGYKNLHLKNQTAELTLPDMRLDLGGIAKGYAADEALRVLRQHGIRRAFAAASGDMALGDPPPGQRGWRIQITNTTSRAETPFLVLKNCGLATSGDLYQFVEIEGKRYSHIVDPRTGLGLTDRSLVTVIAKDGITADVLSTTVSVMGARRGLKLARRFAAEAREIRNSDSPQVESSTPDFWKLVEWIK